MLHEQYSPLRQGWSWSRSPPALSERDREPDGNGTTQHLKVRKGHQGEAGRDDR